MALDFKALDEFPTFTGEESPQEQIRQLQNYLYVMKEQIRYLLQNLGVENLNPAAWLKMQEQTIAGQTQEDVFNKLTNNGKYQGVYQGENGELYINASYIKSGELLADLIKTGVLTSLDGTVKVDLNNNCVTIDGTRNGYKTQIAMSSSGLQGYGENTEGEMKHVLSLLLGVGNLPSGVWSEAWGSENTGLSIGTAEGELSIGTSTAGTNIFGSAISLLGYLGASIVVTADNVFIMGKAVNWKDNGDGTFSLVGR